MVSGVTRLPPSRRSNRPALPQSPNQDGKTRANGARTPRPHHPDPTEGGNDEPNSGSRCRSPSTACSARGRTRCSIALDKIIDGVAVEHNEERFPGLGESPPVDAARSDPGAVSSAGGALDKGDRPLSVPRYRPDRNLLCRAGEPQAPVPAAYSFNESGTAKPPDDLGQVIPGYPVALRNLADGSKALAVDGEIHQDAQRIVGIVGHPHRSPPHGCGRRCSTAHRSYAADAIDAIGVDQPECGSVAG